MAGHQGDQGDQGDQGNFAGPGASGLAASFVDRVDFPFITEPGVGEQVLARDKFGRRNWAANWLAWCTVADFGLTKWQTRIDLSPPPLSSTPQEIEELRTTALEERPDALGEILAQDREFMSYFLAVMGGASNSHPATFLVFNIVNLVATVVAMHFKHKYDRPRPSHLCPALLPPVPVPGHASYPSGHSTQAHLFALCATYMLPPGDQQSKGKVVLEALAHRIARNREIAGLHYVSDSRAGRELAAAIFGVLNDEKLMPHEEGKPSKFAEAMSRARSEWS